MDTLDKNVELAGTSPFDWDIDQIVDHLRALREASLAARQRTVHSSKLPSRKSLAQVITALNQALFPHRLSSRDLAARNVDYYVGQTLDTTLRDLVEQATREIRFHHQDAPRTSDAREDAVAIIRDFSLRLPDIRERLETDIQAAFDGDPTALTLDEVLNCNPGITAVTHYRIAHELYRLGLPLIARTIAELAHSVTGIDIHPGASIGRGLFIDHGTGIVVGQTAIIGDRVQLHHAVTLGALRPRTRDVPRWDPATRRHPQLEDDVVIFAGATLLGPITVGRGSMVGAHVWLTESIPAGSSISQAKSWIHEHHSGSGI